MLWTLLVGLTWADGPSAILAVGDRPAPATPHPDSWVQSLQDCLADKQPEGFHVIDRRTPGATAADLAERIAEWKALSPAHVVIRFSTAPRPDALRALLTGLQAPDPPPPRLILLPPPPSEDPATPAPSWARVLEDHQGVTVVVEGAWHLTEQGNARVGARICEAILSLSKTLP